MPVRVLTSGEDLGLGGLEDAVEAAEQDEGQDDPAVLGLLVVAAQQIGDGPDQAGMVSSGGPTWPRPAPPRTPPRTTPRPLRGGAPLL